nr:spidroin-1-like [Arachis hypogaea]
MQRWKQRNLGGRSERNGNEERGGGAAALVWWLRCCGVGRRGRGAAVRVGVVGVEKGKNGERRRGKEGGEEMNGGIGGGTAVMAAVVAGGSGVSRGGGRKRRRGERMRERGVNGRGQGSAMLAAGGVGRGGLGWLWRKGGRREDVEWKGGKWAREGLGFPRQGMLMRML